MRLAGSKRPSKKRNKLRQDTPWSSMRYVYLTQISYNTPNIGVDP